MNSDWKYPRFLRRLQATLIDGIIAAILFMGSLIIVSHFGITGGDSLIIAIGIILLWEPFFVSVTGGSVGHHLIGIKVVSNTTGKNINFFAAFVRFIVKIVLGNFSIVFIFITRYHQAIHDGLARSVVIVKHPETVPEYEALPARQSELAGYHYPPIWKRGVMMVIYNIALILLIGTLTGLLLPEDCLVYSHCTMWQNITLTAWQLTWVIVSLVIIALCWKGRLLGCRRKTIKENKDEN